MSQKETETYQAFWIWAPWSIKSGGDDNVEVRKRWDGQRWWLLHWRHLLTLDLLFTYLIITDFPLVSLSKFSDVSVVITLLLSVVDPSAVFAAVETINVINNNNSTCNNDRKIECCFSIIIIIIITIISINKGSVYQENGKLLRILHTLSIP